VRGRLSPRGDARSRRPDARTRPLWWLLALLAALLATPVAAGGRPAGAHVAVFATTFAGGVYRRDGDAPWRRLWQSPDPDTEGSRVWSFVATDDGRLLYVSGYTGTLWRSIDGGRIWRRADRGLRLGNGQAATLAHLQADPQDPRVLYGDGFSGLYTTADGGDTWRRLDRGLPTSLVCLMALNRPTGDSLWATASVMDPDVAYRLFHSTDGGATWRAVRGCGLPASAGAACEDTGDLNVAVSPVGARVLYLNAGSPGGGEGAALYRSTDGGARWVSLHARYDTGSEAGPSGALRFDPWHPGRLYISGTDSTGDTVYLSEDGGHTWRKPPGLPPNTQEVIPDPTSPLVAYAPGGRGVYRSVDGGRTWHDWTGPTLPVRDDNQIVNVQVEIVR